MEIKQLSRSLSNPGPVTSLDKVHPTLHIVPGASVQSVVSQDLQTPLRIPCALCLMRFLLQPSVLPHRKSCRI